MDALQAWGGTSLYDAIHYGLNRIKDQPGRKAVVVFSDGADTTSSSMNEQEVVDYARRSRPPSTASASGARPACSPRARGLPAQDREETGGAFFFPDKVGELIKVFGEHLGRAAQPLPARLLARSAPPTAPAADQPAAGQPAGARTPRSACARATSR